MKLATDAYTEYQFRLTSWIKGFSTNPSQFHENSFKHFALELFGLQFNSVAPYQTYCLSLGRTPQSVQDWADIPFLPTSAFKEFSLSSLPETEITHTFLSSGTTEQCRSQHHHGHASLALYETSILQGFDRCFPQWAPAHSDSPRPLFLSLTPPPAQAPHSSLVHMFETLMQHRSSAPPCYFGMASNPSSHWILNTNSIKDFLNALPSQSAPLFLLTTAFSLVQFMDWIRSSQFPVQWPAGSFILETGGYKGQSRSLTPKDLRLEIQEVLGINSSHILCEYGMSELSSQAYDLGTQPPKHLSPPGNHTGRPFQFPPWVGIQILNPETLKPASPGSIGLIRILDLANVRSISSLLTEDLAIAQEDDSFFLLGRSEQSEPKGCSLFSKT